MMTNISLAAIILTYNEELHIKRCIESIYKLTNDIYVVDSFSNDKTIEIAELAGARILSHEFVSHSNQLAWALSTAPIKSKWVLRIDADEILSEELQLEILTILKSDHVGVNGFLVKRYVKFQGHLIRHGGFPHRVIRLWRNQYAFVEDRWMDEHMIVPVGEIHSLKGALIDDSLFGISWWIDKHNKYATREAIDILTGKYGLRNGLSGEAGLSRIILRKRWVKENIYLFLPPGLRALFYFVFRMIFRLGILDGKKGISFHFFQCLWYRYLVDLKVHEIESKMEKDGIGCAEAIKKITGADLIL